MSGGPVPSIPARADRLGVALSLGCAAHCMAAPLLAVSGIGWLLGGWAEVPLLTASMVLAMGSLCWGLLVHRRWGVFLPWGAALPLMIVGRFVAGAPDERLLVVTGAMCLAAGHLLNRHLCRTCTVCPDEGSEGPAGSPESTGWS